MVTFKSPARVHDIKAVAMGYGKGKAFLEQSEPEFDSIDV